MKLLILTLLFSSLGLVAPAAAETPAWTRSPVPGLQQAYRAALRREATPAQGCWHNVLPPDATDQLRSFAALYMTADPRERQARVSERTTRRPDGSTQTVRLYEATVRTHRMAFAEVVADSRSASRIGQPVGLSCEVGGLRFVSVAAGRGGRLEVLAGRNYGYTSDELQARSAWKRLVPSAEWFAMPDVRPVSPGRAEARAAAVLTSR